MEGKRKGERLIITKKRGLVSKRKAKVEIEGQFLKVGLKFRSRRDIQSKRGFMTQEEELKIGEVG